MGTYLTKAIPDTKLTIRRYADAKFAYLSYCLKVKEMDDEEHGYAALQEPSYRVETGNYEYRLVLRCRQDARSKFAGLRSDVLEKMELLESKHARDLANQLKRFVQGLAQLGNDAIERLQVHPNLFPVEVDLKDGAFQYKSTQALQQRYLDGASGGGDEDQYGVEEEAAEVIERPPVMVNCEDILSFENSELTAPPTSGGTDDLLTELGLADIDLTVGCMFGMNLHSVGGGDGTANGGQPIDLLN